MSSKSNAPSPLKPIILYDHLPGILAGYPAMMFALMAVLSYWGKNVFDGHTMFWIGLAVMVVWYIAFRFNLPKSRFWLMFGLFGTFVGIPIVLELSGYKYIQPISFIGGWLGKLRPEVNTGVWIVMSLVFSIMWLANFIWSRTHMRVKIDESGLTINQIGGKGERFELIGLKTENEPLDYLELFLAGVGSLSLKTRLNKPIFTMNRVIGLYRIPWFPFLGNKLKRIEEILSFQGKVYSVDAQDRIDAAEQADAAESEMADGADGADAFDEASHGEFGSGGSPDAGEKPEGGIE